MPDRSKLKERPQSSDQSGNLTSAVVERDAIRNVIAEWALARDTGQWEKLRSLYAPGATMQSLGSVVPDENGRAVLDTVAPGDRFRIVLTPESGDEVTQPTNDPVVVSDVRIRE